jgi:hypothetical protein
MESSSICKRLGRYIKVEEWDSCYARGLVNGGGFKWRLKNLQHDLFIASFLTCMYFLVY